jgi:hypothetical protein
LKLKLRRNLATPNNLMAFRLKPSFFVRQRKASQGSKDSLKNDEYGFNSWLNSRSSTYPVTNSFFAITTHISLTQRGKAFILFSFCVMSVSTFTKSMCMTSPVGCCTYSRSLFFISLSSTRKQTT